MIASSWALWKSRGWHLQSLLLAGIVAGSWAAILGRFAQGEGIPTPVIIAYRMVLSALILTPWVLQRYRSQFQQLTRRELVFTALAGFWMAVHLTIAFAALEYTTVLVSSVLLGSSPLWVALLEKTLLKGVLSRLMWIGLAVTIIGVVLTAGSSGNGLGDNPLLGSVLSLAGAIAASLYSILGRRSRGRVSFVPYIWLVFVFGAGASLLFTALGRMPLVGYSARGYLYLILLTLLPQIVGHMTFNYVLRHLPATYVSVAGELGVVFSALLAFLIFHETPSTLQVPGSLAILVGVTLVNLGRSHTPDAARATGAHQEPNSIPR